MCFKCTPAAISKCSKTSTPSIVQYAFFIMAVTQSAADRKFIWQVIEHDMMALFRGVLLLHAKRGGEVGN